MWFRALSEMKSDVILREVEEGDLAVFFEQQLDPEATEMAAFPSRTRDAFVEHWHKRMAEDTSLLRTITNQGMVAGNVVYREQNNELKVGYWLGKEHWGKGIATSALSQFLRHVSVRPLFARVAKRNVASIRVLEKCGFTVSGEDTFPVEDGKMGEEFIMRLGTSRCEVAGKSSAVEQDADDQLPACPPGGGSP